MKAIYFITAILFIAAASGFTPNGNTSNNSTDLSSKLSKASSELKKEMSSANFLSVEKKLKNKKEQSFDLKSKAKELNVAENDLNKIIKQVDENGGDSLQTDAIEQDIINGYAIQSYFGVSVSGAGDINGDGFSDIIVGAEGYNSYTGRAYVYYGSALGLNTSEYSTLTGEGLNNSFGRAVSSAGDVNNDGYSDIVIGAFGYNSNTGRTYIYLGSSTGISTAPSTILSGTTSSYFGYSVSGADDINGDGYSDVIIGTRTIDKAYLFKGSSSGINTTPITINAPQSGSNFANEVSTAGDVNGDGYSDVIIGAALYSSSTGRAYLYLGSSSGMSLTPATTLTGEATGNFFGASVSSAGDVNADGYSDIIVGAYGYSSGKGRVYLYLGSYSGIIPSVILTGEAANNYFGNSVSTAGDVNGDGYSDIIAGAETNVGMGKAFVFLGSSYGINTVPSAIFAAESANRFAGVVSTAGDINADGYSDLLIGAERQNNATGRVYIYTNSLTGNDIPDFTLQGELSGNFFGTSVADAGDVNGDGNKDIIVGASSHNAGRGKVYLYLGTSSGLNTSSPITLTGEAPGNLMGSSVSGAGDVNRDGYSDILISAEGYNTSTGRVYLYLGSSSGLNLTATVLTGEAVNNSFGESVSGAGDVNGDGYSDIVIGVPGYNSGMGKIHLYFGSSGGINTTPTILAGESNSYFGASVSGAGDLNDDGYSDIIIGAYLYNSSTGRVYIFTGNSSGVSSSSILTGEATGNNFGYSVSCAGDVNKDGFSDVIVGANQYSNSTGRAYLYYGSLGGVNTTVAKTFNGDGGSNQFGICVSGAGDVNGDGYSDVMITSSVQNSNTGKANIYFGGTSMDVLPDVIFRGESVNSSFGSSAAAIGDINKDGLSDVIVSAYNYNSGTGRAYVYMSSAPIINPRIISVKDVPNDEGGFVHLRWLRSGYDFPGINRISNYLIERSRPADRLGFSWEQVAIISANLNPSYTYTATTWADSGAIGSSRMFFRVTARSGFTNEFWGSNITFGQSVDNLAPISPIILSALQNQTCVAVKWKANTEPDLHYYKIYRNDTLIRTSTINSFNDTLPSGKMNSPGSSQKSDKNENNAGTDFQTLYQYKISAVDIHGNESALSDPINVNFALFTAINVTIIPEGFYNTSTGKLNSRDTVMAYLRNAVTPYAIVDSASAVLDSITFTANFEFRNADDGTYYIVIKHRNSLETWSKTGGESYQRGVADTYDFTNNNSQSYGSNMIQKNSKWCIISGDVFKDGTIDANDRGLCWNAKNLTGYRQEDVNGDAVVDAQDRGIIWNNRNRTVQKPL